VLKRLTWKVLLEALSGTAKTTAMILLILVGARIFAYYLTVMHIPQDFAQGLIGLKISPWLIIAGMQVIWIVMGIFLEPGSIIVITTPLFVPAVIALGFSPVWFGAVLMINMAIAMITPPMAMNIFVAAATFKNIPIDVGDITRGTLPFAIAELVALAIVMAFPILSLWLPSLMS
jgi:TRAP-type C4-dicarboxylate transport system permease large subunit